MKLIRELPPVPPAHGKRTFRFLCEDGEGLKDVLQGVSVKRFAPWRDALGHSPDYVATSIEATQVNEVGTWEVAIEYQPLLLPEVRRLREEVAMLKAELADLRTKGTP